MKPPTKPAGGLCLNPEDVDTRFNLAVVYQLQGRFHDAVREYNEVLRRDPGHQPARGNLAALLPQLRTSNLARSNKEFHSMSKRMRSPLRNLGLRVQHN